MNIVTDDKKQIQYTIKGLEETLLSLIYKWYLKI